MAGTNVSEASRYSARVSRQLGDQDYQALLDVAIRQGADGLKSRLRRPYELFKETAQKHPDILPDPFLRAWKRRGKPDSMLWAYFYTSRVKPRLIKARREGLQRK